MATLQEHLRDVDPNRLSAMVPLPHAATAEIFVRQLQALVSPGPQVSDDLVEAWILWFNTHQPAQGGLWVSYPGWVHTLIAPPTDPRPAPSTGGRERVAPPPRPYNLRILLHAGLAAWESRSARGRGHNLTGLAAHYPKTTRAAPPPRKRDPGTIAMIVLENGHYYHSRIIPHPQRGHWSLEAVDFMLSATTDLPDSPTPLLTGQPPDPLTAVVSGTAVTWHPGHALYCLWRWAQRRLPHTRARSAAWRFYLDGHSSWRPSRNGRQRPPLQPTCAPSSRSTRSVRSHWAGNCSPPSVLRRRPRRRTRPWRTKSSVPSAAPLCNAWVTPRGPEPQPATGPAAATRSRTRAARVPRRPCAKGETTPRTRDRLLLPEDRTMILTPQVTESNTNHDDARRAYLAQKDPLVQPNNALPRNTLQQRPSTGHTSGEGVNLRGTCNGHPTLRAHLDQVLHTVVLPGLTRLNSEGARLNR